jgi:acetyltransferase-like isoleucine patch superfamily enzyme
MHFAGRGAVGRCAARFASWSAPPHKERIVLAKMNSQGYIEPTATIYHDDLRLGKHCFIGDRVLVFQKKEGGPVELGDGVYIYRDTTIETDLGGSLSIGAGSSIHPRCQINAFVAPIRIGSGVMIGPNCALYSYNHGIAPDQPIRKQPLESNGPIVIDDEAWLGVGVTVLSGVRIGKGAVIGAGSLVATDIPDGAIAVGMPARVVKMRSDLVLGEPSTVKAGGAKMEKVAFSADEG